MPSQHDAGDPGARVRRRSPDGRACRIVAVTVFVTLIAAACSSGTPARTPGMSGTAPPPPISPATAAPARSNSTGCRVDAPVVPTRSIQIDASLSSPGGPRSYKLYIPARYDGRPAPLVVDLHGYLSGAAGQVTMSNLAATAEAEGFILATPQGNGPMPYWNASPHPDLPDDVQFIADVIDDIGTGLCIDARRVFVDGFSNGAFLASLVACRLADRVAAVAAVAGLMVPAGCAPARPIPILAIHGTADRFVTFDGSPNVALTTLTWNDDSTRAFADLPFAPATAALDRWAGLNTCTQPSEEQPIAASVTRTRYAGCQGGSDVELYVLSGAGHTWPASAFADASAPILGPATHELDATKVIWAFFQTHPMPS